MKKLIFLSITLLCVLFPLSAFAAAEAGNFDAAAEVPVTGVTDKTGSISVSVLNNAFTPQDANMLTAGAVVYANQTEPNSDGTFSLRIKLVDCPTGEYRIRVFQSGSELLDVVRPYATAEDNRAAIEGLNHAAEQGSAAVMEFIRQNHTQLQFVSPVSGELVSAVIAELLTGEAPFDVNDKTACVSVYQRAAVVDAAAEGKIARLTDYADMIKPMCESPMREALREKYVTQKAKERLAGFVHKLAPFHSLQKFDAAVADALILAVTENPTGAGDVRTIITALRPDYDTNRLTAEVCRRVAYKTYSSFSALDAAVTAALSNSGTTGVGSGGGSSGGSGGGGNRIPTVVAGGGTPVQSPNMSTDKDVIVPAREFYDLNGFEWAAEAINGLCTAGVINGKSNGQFCPAENVSREELVKMLILLFDITSEEQKEFPFRDAEEGEWYYPYLQTAYNAGMINGISAEEFGVGMPVTRQDAAVMLAICLKVENGEAEDDILFTDESEIADYALNSVRMLKQRGIITGYDNGEFQPLGLMTRAEAAKILYEGRNRND